MSAIVKWA